MNDTRIIPDVSNFEELLDRAKARTAEKKPRAALVVPSAVPWLRAAAQAVEQGIIDLTVVGDEKLYHDKCREAEVSLDVPVIDINQPDQAFVTAAQMAAKGDLDLIIKGRGDTIEFLQLMLSKDAGFRVKGRKVSHISVIKPEAYPKLLLMTDSGVTPEPDLAWKVALAGNLISFCHAIGIDQPRLAAICAVEAIYPGMRATVEAAALAKMSERGQIKGGFVDGPLSFDCAVDPVAAAAKGIAKSEVAGQADGMIAPTVETANGVYKVMALYGNAATGGLLVGGKVPVALANRWDTVASRFNSIVLAVLAAVA
ncbi:MAG TPA: phosphate acyltransferase [candidate division Zixibacteria bacterium]|nr:phosphate acyltransferase [candidate division Zixibacteria bacterium]